MTTDAITQNDELIDDWLSIVDSIERAQHRMLSDIERSGVAPATFQVLQLLMRAEGYRLPMSRLAKSLSMTGGGFTKLADRMAREGLIDRRHSDTDRRVIRAQLTEEGVKLAVESIERFRASLRDYLLPAMPAHTVHALAESVRVLSDSLASDFIQGLDESAFEVVATPRDPSLPDRRGTIAWTDEQMAAARIAEDEAEATAAAAIEQLSRPRPPASSDRANRVLWTDVERAAHRAEMEAMAEAVERLSGIDAARAAQQFAANEKHEHAPRHGLTD